MRRTKADRIAKTEKVIARRVRQLKTCNGAVPHIRALADHSACGRCSHKRCICHTSQHKDEHPKAHKEAPVIDFPEPDPETTDGGHDFDIVPFDDQYNS